MSDEELGVMMADDGGEVKYVEESEPEAESGTSDDEQPEDDDMDTEPDGKENGKGKGKKKSASKSKSKRAKKELTEEEKQLKEAKDKRVKGARSSYSFFQADYRTKHKDALSKQSFGEASGTIAAEWKALDADAKKPYNDMAVEDVKRYETKLAEWKNKYPAAAKLQEDEANLKATKKNGTKSKRGVGSNKKKPALLYVAAPKAGLDGAEPGGDQFVDPERPNV